MKPLDQCVTEVAIKTLIVDIKDIRNYVVKIYKRQFKDAIHYWGTDDNDAFGEHYVDTIQSILKLLKTKSDDEFLRLFSKNDDLLCDDFMEELASSFCKEHKEELVDYNNSWQDDFNLLVFSKNNDNTVSLYANLADTDKFLKNLTGHEKLLHRKSRDFIKVDSYLLINQGGA